MSVEEQIQYMKDRLKDLLFMGQLQKDKQEFDLIHSPTFGIFYIERRVDREYKIFTPLITIHVVHSKKNINYIDVFLKEKNDERHTFKDVESTLYFIAEQI